MENGYEEATYQIKKNDVESLEKHLEKHEFDHYDMENFIDTAIKLKSAKCTMFLLKYHEGKYVNKYHLSTFLYHLSITAKKEWIEFILNHSKNKNMDLSNAIYRSAKYGRISTLKTLLKYHKGAITIGYILQETIRNKHYSSFIALMNDPRINPNSSRNSAIVRASKIYDQRFYKKLLKDKRVQDAFSYEDIDKVPKHLADIDEIKKVWVDLQNCKKKTKIENF
jgi:hypothetical protein